MFAPLMLALLSPYADAAGDILAQIRSPDGWVQQAVKEGVTIYRKDLPGVDVPAFMGKKTVDVSCDTYFQSVSDPNSHKTANDMLFESATIGPASGENIVFYQVLNVPYPASDRMWVCSGKNIRNVNGEPGHHLQTWSILPRDAYPELTSKLEDKYDAVYTLLNYGYWELVPAGPSSCNVTYVAISHPGGNVPDGAATWASTKSLPFNVNGFLAVAKGK